MRMSTPSRRHVLAMICAGGAALASRRAAGIGDASRFRVGQLRHDGNWDPRPDALRRLMWEIDKRTSIDVDLEPKPVALGDDDLHESPFLYLAGDGEFSLPGGKDLERLRRFLTFGGFLLVDSAEGRTDGAFDRSVRKLCDAVFAPPAEGLRLIGKDHVLYRSFYLIDRPVGRLAVSPVMEGIVHDDRLAVVYTQNDLAGAYARDDIGNWELSCDPDGERQRELAFRLGINIAMYALCHEYKSDQVHVDFIMRRRKWRAGDGEP
jgi:hypothetical protein